MGCKFTFWLLWFCLIPVSQGCDLSVFRELLTPKERFDAIVVPQSKAVSQPQTSSLDSYHSPGDHIRFTEVITGGSRVSSEIEYFPNPQKNPQLKLKGYFEIDASPQNVVFNDAFLDDAVRTEDQTFRIPRRGSHPKDYRLAVYQMVKLIKWKMGKNSFGSIPLFGQRNVVHFDSVVDLTLHKKSWEKENGRPMPESEMVKYYRTTPVFKYIETVINETGHDVVNVEAYFRPGYKLNGLYGQNQQKKMPELTKKLRIWNERYAPFGVHLTFEDEAIAHFDVAIEVRPTHEGSRKRH